MILIILRTGVVEPLMHMTIIILSRTHTFTQIPIWHTHLMTMTGITWTTKRMTRWIIREVWLPEWACKALGQLEEEWLARSLHKDGGNGQYKAPKMPNRS